MASAQLQLIQTDHTWKLDRHTVQVGRAGLAKARAALAAATQLSDTEGQLFDYAVGRIDQRPTRATGTESGERNERHRTANRPEPQVAA